MSSHDANEKDKMIKLKQGDIEIFTEMFRLHHQSVFNYIYVKSGGNVALSEDIMQQTFLNLWENRAKYDIEKPIVPLLITIARNMWINIGKRKEHRPIAETASTHSAEQSFQAKELENAIKAAIAELDETSREVFILSRYQGMTYPEIAFSLGVSQKTVEKYMNRALAHMEKKLQVFRR